MVTWLDHTIHRWYVTGPNFRYKCDRRGLCVCELNGALGGVGIGSVVTDLKFCIVVAYTDNSKH